MPRLFVAVRPPTDALDAVTKTVAPARRSMVGPRWTTHDQWHLTVQFLGAVPGESLDEVSRALDAASRVPPFPVRLGGAGAFPKPGRARVLWLGVAAGYDGMERLATAVGAALGPLGYESDGRPYHPHLTLARLKVPGDVGPALEAIGGDPVGPAFTVSEAVLYESRRSRQGARYEALSAIALEG